MATKKRIRCNQCEALMINGVFCHEPGCPNGRARYDADSEMRDEQGATLIPVLAVLTAFTVAAVLVAQSGLLHAVLARLAEVR